MPHAQAHLRFAGLPLGLALLAPLLAPLAGCVPALTVDDIDDSALKEDESRTIELRYLRLDAKGFEQTLTKADIKKKFPEKTLRETWLLDMPIEPLITNALTILVETPEDVAYAELEQPALNMWKLLNMTPANTVLTGSSLEPLLGIGEAVGLPPSLVLSNLIGIPANQGIISIDLTTPAILENVISTHPNSKLRRAPANSTCPDGKPAQSGMCAVAPASMPVSLWDVVTDFQDLARTFGPTPDPDDPSAPPHPGFIKSASPIVAATDDFEMTVRVDLNALPYKGVDLTSATVASINSTSSQINQAFDFTTPDWMEIKGLVPALVIDELEMSIAENDEYVQPGTSPDPAPLGDGEAWDLPPWQFERLIGDVAVARAAELTAHCNAYFLEGNVEMPYEAIQVCLGQGAFLADGEPCDPNSTDPDCQFDTNAPAPPHWVSLAVDDIVKLEDPLPPQSYFWDVLLEVAQLRLHDGGLAEGEGDVAFTLHDIPAGITTAELEKQIRDNIQKNPAALAAIAELLNENTDGEADFYYYVAGPEAPADQQGDWLFFIDADDIKNDTNGGSVRPYSDYKTPGFFKDPSGKQMLSSNMPAINGDTSHQKLKIAPGDVFYAQDDDGSVFKIEVNDKPGRHKVSLTVTRIH